MVKPGLTGWAQVMYPYGASVEDARRMLEETGCDAIMIGRAALGNPWLIKQVVRKV